ncbi:hypothetical protein [Paenirhodobacter populi]|uniref:DUF2163 domain-containing protein n=1 Tax=Paenirhodobacter populi TaxID=2306993 RepID=A0A443JE72_9RHOB|nr:hypothetical protein [Sinirhodobacter populi]RWR18794.1 hypothetical protein D2T30_15650 [Sinirhodobacter populi]
MSRDLSPANAAALAADRVRIIALFEGEFASGTVRLWSGLGSLVWGGRTWAGAGTLMGIGSIEETNEVTANGASISLSGVPLDLVQIAIDEAQQGAPGRLYLGFMSEDWQLLADPELIFAGLLDVPQIEEGADTCTVTISYENQLIDLQRAREWRYTDESQKTLYPGDRGFEFVTTIQDMDLDWEMS